MTKWRVFREKVPRSWNPMWVVWDDHFGEHLFKSGCEALGFVHWELTRRKLAMLVSDRKEAISSGLA